MKCPPEAQLAAALLAIRPNTDVELIGRAYDVAAQCHQGQIRRSGDPYITHPVAVAKILAGLGAADDQMLCAAILHDTVDDTPYTMPELRRDFGTGISAMVKGTGTLDRVGKSRPEQGSPASNDLRICRRRGRRLEARRPATTCGPCSTCRRRRNCGRPGKTINVNLPSASSSEGTGQIGNAGTRLRVLYPQPARRPAPVPGHRGRPPAIHQPPRSGQGRAPDHAVRAVRGGAAFGGHRPTTATPVRQPPRRPARPHRPRRAGPAAQPRRSRLRPAPRQLQRQPARAAAAPVRVVVHAGEVRRDDEGLLRRALDVACRLLDAPEAKAALKAATGPASCSSSGDIYHAASAVGREAFAHRHRAGRRPRAPRAGERAGPAA